MSELFNIVHFTVHDGQQDAFEDLSLECIDIVKEKDTGTLQYDWYFNDDRSECVVHERYASSAAVLEHVSNLGDTLGALLGVSDMVVEIYGAPSQALLDATAGMDIRVYGYARGLGATSG